MKAHINLLTIDERRDPRGMLLRTTIGTLSAVAVVAVVLYGIHAVFTLNDAQRRQRRAEAQWVSLKPDYERAENLRILCEDLERVSAELAAFSNVQITVSSRLLCLAQCVHPEVQIMEAGFNQFQVDDHGVPSRQYEMKLIGRTATEGSDGRVQGIIEDLQSVPEPDDFGTVIPGGIRVDPQSKDALESVFEIRCLFIPRSYQ